MAWSTVGLRCRGLLARAILFRLQTNHRSRRVRFFLAIRRQCKAVAGPRFGRLYRGLLPPLMLEAPKRAVKFSANGCAGPAALGPQSHMWHRFWGTTYKEALGVDKMTQSLSVLTGCSAGATEAIVVVPFEYVRCTVHLCGPEATQTGQDPIARQG
jgi:hypothetical protein